MVCNRYWGSIFFYHIKQENTESLEKIFSTFCCEIYSIKSHFCKNFSQNIFYKIKNWCYLITAGVLFIKRKYTENFKNKNYIVYFPLLNIYIKIQFFALYICTSDQILVLVLHLKRSTIRAEICSGLQINTLYCVHLQNMDKRENVPKGL